MANIQQIQVNSVNYPIAGYQFDGEWVRDGYVDLKVYESRGGVNETSL